jgi:hypothetical protein
MRTEFILFRRGVGGGGGGGELFENGDKTSGSRERGNALLQKGLLVYQETLISNELVTTKLMLLQAGISQTSLHLLKYWQYQEQCDVEFIDINGVNCVCLFVCLFLSFLV